MTSNEATAEDQTYVINCGNGGAYPVGNKVTVRLEDTNKPLEIAEIIVFKYKGKVYPDNSLNRVVS